MNQLSDNDVAVLRELVREWRGDRENQDRSPKYPENDHQAPEVYVALTPPGGIPALMEPGLGTGTGSGNEANFASCAIYRLLPVDGNLTAFDLHPVFGLNHDVYNLSETAVAGDSWVLAVRDKFGVWWAVPTATGGTTAFIGAAYTRGDQSIASGSFTETIVWQSPLYDTSSFVSPPSATITVPASGKYLFEAQVEWDSNTANRLDLSIVPAGPPANFPTTRILPMPGALASFQQCSGVLNLLGGTTVTIGVFQDSGSPVNVINNGTWFSVSLLK